MSRKRKLMLNSITSILLQVITIISGFILPRLYLTYYGSAVNGLVSSITQYLGFISLAECGIGAVTQSALYKPLANNDQEQISKVIQSSEKFFRKLGYLLLIYIIILVFIYPHMINSSFDWWYTVSLILAISISTFAQYYFCMSYKLLLTADQLGFIQQGFQIITVILNTGLNAFFTVSGFSIQVVKLSTSIVFLLQPIALSIYVRNHYHIDKHIELTEEPIKQKWNGLAQHISAVVLSRTDIAVLTFFSLVSVSIYNVYFMVVYGVKAIIESLTNAVQAYLGNIYAKEEKNQLDRVFSTWECISHATITFLYSCVGILLVPFVSIYTKDVTDGNYIVPTFSALLTIAYAFFCLRYPYTAIIKVAGHYRETQMSCIIEAVLNVVLSIILVYSWGLSGVAIATLAAMIYRTLYCVFYLKNNILRRPVKYYFKNLTVDFIGAVLCVILTSWIQLSSHTWIGWIWMALKVAPICFLVICSVNIVFYYKKIAIIYLFIKKRAMR